MSITAVNLPINIPWTQVATSVDMIDMRHNHGAFPEPWRSSLAIYAYEPSPEELDPALCNRQITFLKVTCSITGIQYSDVEQDQLIDWADKHGKLLGAIEDVTQAYFACYGMLLQVSVSPNAIERDVPVADFPHIIDFEPKKRDLYQAATETGEILTASKGSIQTGKSFTDTKTSETGITPKVSVPLGESGAAAGAEFSQKWGSTASDSSSSSTDSSRESRETHGTTTNITQMYNFLTGYHAGTNRATFLMLPRPHNLQPTERRTFVNGLREIEGVQEFFLIVERPRAQAGICVEAQLQTGHFSESVPMTPGSGAFEAFQKPYTVDEEETAGFGTNKTLTIAVTSAPFTNSDVVLDYENDNPGHGPVSEVIRDEPAILVNAHVWLETLERPSYRIDPDGVLHVDAKYKVNGPWLPGAPNSFRFRRDYNVSLKRKSGSGPATVADPGGLVIASRSVAACITRTEDGCLIPTQQPRPDGLVFTDIRVPNFETPLNKLDVVHLQRELQRGMSRAAAATRRRPGVKQLIETDFVARRLAKLLPKETLDGPARLAARDDAACLGDATVRDVLSWTDSRLARRLGIEVAHARAIRARVLGLSLPDSAAD